VGVEQREVSDPKVARPVPFSSSHRTSESPDLIVGSSDVANNKWSVHIASGIIPPGMARDAS